MNWDSQRTQDKLDLLEGKLSAEQGYVMIQVVPRHSKLYYENQKNNIGNLKASISGGYNLKKFISKGVTDGVVQLSYTRYSSSNVFGSTIDSLIDNYDAFASGQVPMFIIKQTGLSTSSAAIQIYEIGFEKK